MTVETYTALREYRRRIAAMFADPDCTGDLLLLGIALLDKVVLRCETSDASAYYGAKAGLKKWQVTAALRGDIRRYDALKDADSRDPARRCGAPMMRRQGPCGQSASRRALLTDPDTGRQQWVAACSRHVEWFDGRVRANRAHCEVETVAIPAANAGGVLARHIPEIDWHVTWSKLDPRWTPPPEGEDEPTGVVPKLTLVLGGA